MQKIATVTIGKQIATGNNRQTIANNRQTIANNMQKIAPNMHCRYIRTNIHHFAIVITM